MVRPGGLRIRPAAHAAGTGLAPASVHPLPAAPIWSNRMRAAGASPRATGNNLALLAILPRADCIGPLCAVLSREGDQTLPHQHDSFVHLHSEHSLLHGFCRLLQQVRHAKPLDISAMTHPHRGPPNRSVESYRLPVRAPETQQAGGHQDAGLLGGESVSATCKGSRYQVVAQTIIWPALQP